MAVNIGPRIGIDGEADFRKQLNNIIQQCKTLDSEMKSVTSSFNANDQSQEKLTQQSEVLTKQIQAQTQRLEMLQKGLAESANKYGDADTKAQKWQQAVNEATTTLNRMQRQLDDINSAMETNAFDDLTRQIEEQEAEVKRLRTAYQNAVLEFGDTSDEAEQLGRELSSASAELKQSRSAMRSAANAADELDNSLDDAADSADDLDSGFSSLGDIIGGNVIADGISGVVSGIKDLHEESLEYRRIMASLETSSENAGYSAKETAEIYEELFGVLGDNQTAATTTANLQALHLEQEDLKEITEATIGAWATYGDSIPIDSLAEAINETIQVGKVTGTFADVLNWAGSSEDEFNKLLSETNDATERANIVLKELSRQGLDDAGRAWQENNKSLVEANEATAEQQKALAELAEVAEPVLTELTELSTDFIQFILDNRKEVISAIAGIGAGFAAWKVTDAINKAKSAMDAFNASVKANPMGLVITAVSTAVGVLSSLAAQTQGVNDDLAQTAQKVKSLNGEIQESGKALSGALDSAEEKLGDLSASGELARGVADDLERLADKTSLTNTEQEEMALLVDELNTLFPDLKLEIDKVTGSLNKTVREIDEYIESAQKMAEVQALEEITADIMSEMVDTEKDVVKARVEREDITEKVTKLEQEYQKAIDLTNESVQDGGDGLIEWNGEMRRSEDVLSELSQQVKDYSRQEQTLSDTIQTGKDSISAANDEYLKYKDQLGDLQGELSNTAVSHDEAASAIARQNTQTRELAAQFGQEIAAFQAMDEETQILAVDVTKAVMSMQQSVRDYLGQSTQLFQKFVDTSSVDTQELLQNFQSQVDGVRQWETNLTTLMDSVKTTSDGVAVELEDGLIQYLQDMGPEGAAYVQAFVNMSGDELAKANELWAQKLDIENFTNEEGQKLKQNVAEVIAGGEEELAKLQAQWEIASIKAGTGVTHGFVDGMMAAAEQATDAMGTIGDDVLARLDEIFQFGSPSHVTTQQGQWVSEGFYNGIRENATAVRAAGQEIAREALFGLRAVSVSDFRSVGLNLAEVFANGISAGRSAVINASTSMAQAAIDAARSTLDINSPSKVFREIGEYTSEGFLLGMEDVDLKREVSRILDFQQRHVNAVMALQYQNVDEIYSVVYSAVKSGMQQVSDRDKRYMDILDNMSKRPVVTQNYMDGRPIGYGVAPYVTTKQQQDTKIRNWVNGVKT